MLRARWSRALPAVRPLLTGLAVAAVGASVAHGAFPGRNGSCQWRMAFIAQATELPLCSRTDGRCE